MKPKADFMDRRGLILAIATGLAGCSGRIPIINPQQSTPVLNQSANPYGDETTVTPTTPGEWFEWSADVHLEHGEYAVYTPPSNPRLELEIHVSNLTGEGLDLLTMLLDQYTFYSNRKQFKIIKNLSKKAVATDTVITGQKKRGQDLITVFDNTDLRTTGTDELSFSTSIRFKNPTKG